MKTNLEIRIHGRGGQGAVTAAELIAKAAFLDGKACQAFPNFGVERRGAPIMAFVRLCENPIRNREQVQMPDYIIVQDSSLLMTVDELMVGAKEAKAMIVDSEKQVWPELKDINVIGIPATKIAIEKIGKPFINVPLVGAFAAISKAVTLESLKQAVKDQFESKGQEIIDKNLAALEEAYMQVNKS